MASRKGRKNRSRKKNGFWGRAAYFLFFLGTGSFLYTQRCDLAAVLRAALQPNAQPLVVEGKDDLPPGGTCCDQPARVVGIPDYRNPVHLPVGGRQITCFRFLGFDNRLIACSPAGLKQPQDIEEIIRKRSLEGGLSLPRSSPLRASLQRGFRSRIGTELEPDSYLLWEERPRGPSPVKIASLVGAVLLCGYSLIRVARSFG